jgi:carboxymethylenebutenolidase
MKNGIVLLFFTLMMTTPAFAQSSCCHAKSDLAFADFADDSRFGVFHDVPVPYIHDSKSGKLITFNVKDGKKANGFLIKSVQPSNNWLIVVHEWWGLNEHIKKEADRLFHDLKNVNVLAIDLYDGKVADTRELAGQYMKAVEKERLLTILDGAIGMAGKDAKIATVGWCFGGGWSLQAAIQAGKNGVGCIIYYGMPESDPERLKRLKAPVLGIFAKEDKWITPAVVEAFAMNMKNSGQTITIKQFKADHAFANPSSERYNSSAAREAYVLSRDFLNEIFK